MATLKPMDASQLLRLLTADLGRPPTGSDAVTLALSLRHIAQAVDHDDTSGKIGGLELRQLAAQLTSTAGLADAMDLGRYDRQPHREASELALCASMLKVGPEQGPRRVVQCEYHAGHERLYLHKHTQPDGTEVTWSDSHPNVVGF